jgi:anti-anti-sigma factor
MTETIDGPLDRSPSGLDRPYSSTLDQSARVLRVHGVVDEMSAHTFRDDLLGALEAGADLTVDLGDVDFFPSVGVGALVAGIRQATAAGGTLEVLVVAGSVPQRVLSICQLPHRVA